MQNRHLFLRRAIGPTSLGVLLLVGVGSLASCKYRTGITESEPEPPSGLDAQGDEVKKETKEAVRAMKDYSYAQKADFVGRMNEDLAQLQQSLDRLSAKVDSTTGTAKDDAKRNVEVVRERWVTTKKQLAEAERATESTWVSVRTSVEESYNGLVDTLDRTRL